MWKVKASRWLNATFLGGDPQEMVSSRMYREKRYGWMVVLDFFWFLVKWEAPHCRRAFIWEREYRRGEQTLESTTSQAEGTPPPQQKGA